MQMTLDGFNDYYGPNEGLQNGPPRSLSRVSWAIGSLTLTPSTCARP